MSPIKYDSFAYTRRVWAAVTRMPHASVQELATAIGKPSSISHVSNALHRLHAMGYIEQRPRCARARVVVVSFYEVPA